MQQTRPLFLTFKSERLSSQSVGIGSRSERLILWIQLFGVSLLFGLPSLLGLLRLGGDYTPFSSGPFVSAQVFDETQLYVSGPVRFMRNGSLPSETDLLEFSSYSNGYPILHSIVIGSVARILGSVERAWMVFHALLPMVLWFCFYLIFAQFTSNRILRSVGSWIGVLFPFAPRNSLLSGSMALFQPLELMRLPHPALSYSVLLIGVIGLVRALSSGKRFTLVSAGILMGLSCYAYYFNWIAFFSGVAIAFVLTLIYRQGELARKLCLVGGCAVATGVPYFIRVAAGMREGHQRELLQRVGSFTHQFTLGHMLIGVALVITLLIYQGWHRSELSQKRVTEERLLLWALLAILAGAGIGLNLQVISGYNAQHGHYFNRIIQPTAFLFLFACALKLVQKYSVRWLSFAGVVAAMLFVGIAGYRQYQSTLNTLSEHRISTTSLGLVQWLQNNSPGDEVIGTSDPELSILIPSLSANYTFVPVSDRTMAPTAEILNRLLIISKLEGRSLEGLLTQLRQKTDDGLRLWQSPSYVFFQSNLVKEEIVDEAQNKWPLIEMKKELATRQLDYLVLSRHQSLASLGPLYPKARTVYVGSHWNLVKLR